VDRGHAAFAKPTAALPANHLGDAILPLINSSGSGRAAASTAPSHLLLARRAGLADSPPSRAKRDPAAARAAFDRGWRLLGHGDLDGAASEFTAVIEWDPNHAVAHAWRAEVCRRRNQLDKAMEGYTRAIELRRDLPVAYAGRGYVYLRRSQLDKALDDCTTAITLHNANAAAYATRGCVHAAQGRLDKAMEDFNRAITFDPKQALAYAGRGGVYSGQGKWNRALDDCTTAIGLDPGLPDAYSNRGIVYVAFGWWDRALEDYTTAVKLDPKHALAYAGRGQTYFLQGHFDKALQDYTRAIELRPRDPFAYEGRATVYQRQNQLDKAVDDCTTAIELEPKFGRAYATRGAVHASQGRLDKALDDLNRAIELTPTYAHAYLRRGHVYADKARFDMAIWDFNDSIRLMPRLSAAYRSRAGYRLLRGEWAEADSDNAIARFLETGIDLPAQRVRTNQPIRSGDPVVTICPTALAGDAVEDVVSEVPAGTDLVVARVDGNRVEVKIARGGKTITGWIHVDDLARSGGIREVGLGVFMTLLESSSQRGEYVDVQLVRVKGTKQTTVQAIEYQGVFLIGYADHTATLSPQASYRYLDLSFHFPRARTLTFPRGAQVVLSEHAQRYLILERASDYEATRSLLIVAEPHDDLDQHLALLAGLEAIFSDNPSLLSENRTALLAEGYPSGKNMPLDALITAEPTPEASLIHRVLASYLVPAYVAYVWKHQAAIPVVGIEDPQLHRISNQLHIDYWSKATGDGGGSAEPLYL
jgi:tetratricopeptide (TPR) repeat protein